jgi:peptide/nickel transport system ATP-binding protein
MLDTAHSPADSLLQVRGLSVVHNSSKGPVTILSSVNLDVARGETVGIVGESGSGKSIMSKAVAGLLPPGVVVSDGSIEYDGTSLLDLDDKARAKYRGERITLMYQDPFTMLNPLMRSGAHIVEGLRLGSDHRISRSEGREEAVRRFAEVGITDSDVVDRYAFELSGGMRQRVALASALARDPDLLIADEPSTALDVTTQAEILDLLHRTQQARGMSMVLITHDLRVAFSVCDRVFVLYAGSMLEVGKASDLQAQPLHPYTHGLLLSEPTATTRQAELLSIEGTVPPPDEVADQCTFAPRCQWANDACRAGRPEFAEVGPDHLSRCIRITDIVEDMRAERASVLAPVETHAIAESTGGVPVVSVTGVHKTFETGRGEAVRALRGVSLDIARGDSVGLVGESGSGKTTLGRCVVGLDTPTDGEIILSASRGSNAEEFLHPTDKEARRVVQIVFQDPYSSLDPRQKIGPALMEPVMSLGASRAEASARAASLIETVGLPHGYLKRHPSSLSGGERQRVAIARALSLEPELLVCDEPVSALDVSVQAQILKLFRELREQFNLSLLFITHDLAVVRQVVDTVHILYQGEIVESGDVGTVMDAPTHPYTKRLIASIPGEDVGVGGSSNIPTS